MKIKIIFSAFSFVFTLEDQLGEQNVVKMESRNYPISFVNTQENISQILLKSEEKRKVAANLLCWKCKAENMENCYEKGEIEICDGRLESCGLEERRWEGILVGVELGCKSSLQCHSDISTNFIAATNQCRPTESGHSMCRQCCATDMCNRGWKIRSESGWQYDYLS